MVQETADGRVLVFGSSPDSNGPPPLLREYRLQRVGSSSAATFVDMETRQSQSLSESSWSGRDFAPSIPSVDVEREPPVDLAREDETGFTIAQSNERDDADGETVAGMADDVDDTDDMPFVSEDPISVSLPIVPLDEEEWPTLPEPAAPRETIVQSVPLITRPTILKDSVRKERAVSSSATVIPPSNVPFPDVPGELPSDESQLTDVSEVHAESAPITTIDPDLIQQRVADAKRRKRERKNSKKTKKQPRPRKHNAQPISLTTERTDSDPIDELSVKGGAMSSSEQKHVDSTLEHMETVENADNTDTLTEDAHDTAADHSVNTEVVDGQESLEAFLPEDVQPSSSSSPVDEDVAKDHGTASETSVVPPIASAQAHPSQVTKEITAVAPSTNDIYLDQQQSQEYWAITQPNYDILQIGEERATEIVIDLASTATIPLQFLDLILTEASIKNQQIALQTHQFSMLLQQIREFATTTTADRREVKKMVGKFRKRGLPRLRKLRKDTEEHDKWFAHNMNVAVHLLERVVIENPSLEDTYGELTMAKLEKEYSLSRMPMNAFKRLMELIEKDQALSPVFKAL